MAFLAAFQFDRIDAPYVLDRPINGIPFTAWVERCLVPTLKPGDVVVTDNLRQSQGQGPEQTAKAYDRNGWATLGDVGGIDDEGFPFLTDRKSFMIISGGVNIYPQEIENCLVTHPSVADVAMTGVPDEEMGECVLAIAQPAGGVVADDRLAEKLWQFARNALGGVKTPRRFELRAELPREPTGKLMKRKLVDEFRAKAAVAA